MKKWKCDYVYEDDGGGGGGGGVETRGKDRPRCNPNRVVSSCKKRKKSFLAFSVDTRFSQHFFTLLFHFIIILTTWNFCLNINIPFTYFVPLPAGDSIGKHSKHTICRCSSPPLSRRLHWPSTVQLISFSFFCVQMSGTLRMDIVVTVDAADHPNVVDDSDDDDGLNIQWKQ